MLFLVLCCVVVVCCFFGVAIQCPRVLDISVSRRRPVSLSKSRPRGSIVVFVMCLL